MTQITAEQVLSCLTFRREHKSDPRLYSLWRGNLYAEELDRYKLCVYIESTVEPEEFKYQIALSKVSHPLTHKEEWKTIWTGFEVRRYDESISGLIRKVVDVLVDRINNAREEVKLKEIRREYRNRAIENALAHANEMCGSDDPESGEADE